MSQRSECETSADIHQRQRSTWPKKKSNKRACFRCLSRSVEIEHPHDREVLHIVPGFEQCEAHERTFHHTGRLAKVHECCGDEDKLQRVRSMSMPDGGHRVEDVYNRRCDGYCKPAAREPNESLSRNARSTALVEIGHV